MRGASWPFTADLASVPILRHLAYDWLSDVSPPVRYDAVLIVSELVTNAVCHGADDMSLRVSCHAGCVRVEVLDGASGAPVPVDHPGEGDHGRGLALVAELASTWGVEHFEGTGKTVWAEIPDGAHCED